MKKMILATALVSATFSAAAEPTRSERCAVSANYYAIAAQDRDMGLSPQQALLGLKESRYISLQNVKDIINTVYFDPAFERAGGDALLNQMANLCMHGPKRYTPLK